MRGYRLYLSGMANPDNAGPIDGIVTAPYSTSRMRQQRKSDVKATPQPMPTSSSPVAVFELVGLHSAVNLHISLYDMQDTGRFP